MSFYLGVATPDLALLAADVRRRYPGLGDRIVDDVCQPKLRRLRGGWVTGSAIATQWLRLAYRRIGHHEASQVDEIATALAELRGSAEVEALRDLEGWEAAVEGQPVDRRDRIGDLVLTYRTSDGFAAATVTDRGERRRLQAGQLVFNTLREADDRAIMEQYGTHVAGPADTELELFRRVGRLWTALYNLCGPRGSVSAAVEIALMMRDRAGRVVHWHLPPMRAEHIVGSGDDRLTGLTEVSHD